MSKTEMMDRIAFYCDADKRTTYDNPCKMEEVAPTLEEAFEMDSRYDD
jgi:hypothetical protein